MKSSNRIGAIATTTVMLGLCVLIVVSVFTVQSSSTIRIGERVLLEDDGRVWRVEETPHNGTVVVSCGAETAKVSMRRVQPIERPLFNF